ncbi:hypothetical protein L1281_001743 [Neisseria sp. HSC-16F19]|nr:hypothetical protein [Neisseria sp. HSC-16F19]MCP2041149.1 hypothetical protein [Neisseria sp. HSC-16F19]
MNKQNYTPAVAKAQKKYAAGLRQFKFAVSKENDGELIRLLEAIPNLKAWVIDKLKRDNAMKIKVINVPNGRRLVKGKYADILDLDYTQDLEALRQDIELALPSLLENLSLLESLTTSGDIIVYKGGSHIDIVLDGKGSLGWLKVEHHNH